MNLLIADISTKLLSNAKHLFCFEGLSLEVVQSIKHYLFLLTRLRRSVINMNNLVSSVRCRDCVRALEGACMWCVIRMHNKVPC